MKVSINAIAEIDGLTALICSHRTDVQVIEIAVNIKVVAHNTIIGIQVPAHTGCTMHSHRITADLEISSHDHIAVDRCRVTSRQVTIHKNRSYKDVAMVNRRTAKIVVIEIIDLGCNFLRNIDAVKAIDIENGYFIVLGTISSFTCRINL